MAQVLPVHVLSVKENIPYYHPDKADRERVLRYRVTGRVLSRPKEMVAAGVCAFRRGIPDVAGLVDVDGEVIPSLVREVFCPMWRERAKTPHAQVRSSASVSA